MTHGPPRAPGARPLAVRRACAVLLSLCACLAAVAAAAGVDGRHSQARAFFPGAERIGAAEGDPPAAPVFRDGRLVGYVFETADIARIPAYSGRPINTLVGLDLAGRIVGVEIVHHDEPILAIGITPERLKRFTDQYLGKSALAPIAVGAPRPGHQQVDTITGATITVMVQNATLTRAARRVAESRGLGTESAGSAVPLAPGAAASRGPAAGAGEAPLWVPIWRERSLEVALLVAGLTVLTLILVFQDWLAKRPRLLAWARDGFLVFTVVFIGWYALAQLSVMNVLTFVHAAFRDFRWEHFLIDPMLFILWSFVALTLLLWGRGVYCGWLCPYGALQELTQQLARRFKVPQLEFPDVVHERLWAVKYIILVVLFGISLQSIAEAARYAEVEPFKTVFALRLDREWPFVAYAVGLVAVSAVNRKLFCKYLCPLGAALAIPGRFRIFDWWLRRRKECGRPCQICYTECEVRAIRPTGEINANECHYCLDCQVTYYSDKKCPPVVDWRRRQQRLPRAREVVKEMESVIGPYGVSDGAQRERGTGEPRR
ncbi:MAG: 4Fe-4S binding protein [Pseudomonadota bacterium]